MGGFTTLVTALQAADFEMLLSDSGPYTVFAPSNAAFDSLGDELLGCLLQTENVLVLQEILSYHYTYGKVLAGDLTNEQYITMANGREIKIKYTLGCCVVINDKYSSSVGLDVPATNGVIHAIDNVLVPPGLDVPGFLETCQATDPPVVAPTTPLTPAPQPEPTPSPTKKSRKRSKKGKAGRPRNNMK